MKSVTRIISHIIILLIIVQAVSGILLSLHYVPDGGQAEIRNSVPGTLHYANEALIRGGDTLAAAREYTLVPARKGDVVPSGAAASVSLTIEHQVAGGSAVRFVHHANASALVIAMLTLFVLLIVQRAWSSQRRLWWTVVVGMVILLIEAFTGKLLPDDVYSYISSQIVWHEVSEFPFGSSWTSILGLNARPAARLSTPYAMHALVLPVFLSVGVCLVWRQFGRPSPASLLGCVLAVGLGALVSTGYYPVRDLGNNIQTSGSISPWWPFVVPNAVVTWLGGELAGYFTLAAFVGLLTMPFWMGRKK